MFSNLSFFTLENKIFILFINDCEREWKLRSAHYICINNVLSVLKVLITLTSKIN